MRKEKIFFLDSWHIETLSEFSEKIFIFPIVITIKQDGSVKLALEMREINKP